MVCSKKNLKIFCYVKDWTYICNMKKVHGKYIRLTEQELQRLIMQEVERKIPLLLEYAIPRQEFIENAAHLIPQICENWCLIRYSRLVNDNNENINHWKSELSAHMRNISSTKIKKNNAVPSRVKCIKEAFNWYDFDTSATQIYEWTNDKFRNEGYPSDYKEPLITVCFDFKHAVDILTELMSNSNDGDITRYIETL